VLEFSEARARFRRLWFEHSAARNRVRIALFRVLFLAHTSAGRKYAFGLQE
jgi:hypothetical protein